MAVVLVLCSQGHAVLAGFDAECQCVIRKVYHATEAKAKKQDHSEGEEEGSEEEPERDEKRKPRKVKSKKAKELSHPTFRRLAEKSEFGVEICSWGEDEAVQQALSAAEAVYVSVPARLASLLFGPQMIDAPLLRVPGRMRRKNNRARMTAKAEEVTVAEQGRPLLSPQDPRVRFLDDICEPTRRPCIKEAKRIFALLRTLDGLQKKTADPSEAESSRRSLSLSSQEQTP